MQFLNKYTKRELLTMIILLRMTWNSRVPHDSVAVDTDLSLQLNILYPDLIEDLHTIAMKLGNQGFCAPGNHNFDGKYGACHSMYVWSEHHIVPCEAPKCPSCWITAVKRHMSGEKQLHWLFHGAGHD